MVVNMPAKAYITQWFVVDFTTNKNISEVRSGRWENVDIGGHSILFQLNLQNVGDEMGTLFGEISEVMPRRTYTLAPGGTVAFPVTFTFPNAKVHYVATAGHNGVADDTLHLTWSPETKVLEISETAPPPEKPKFTGPFGLWTFPFLNMFLGGPKQSTPLVKTCIETKIKTY
jgi:hypothetical protein